MTPKPVIALEEVSDDLEAGADFYQSWRSDGAIHFRELWRDAIAAIERNPEAFPCRHRFFRQALLHQSYYAVFFAIEPEVTVVVAVLDLRQSPRRVRRVLRHRRPIRKRPTGL